MPSQTRKQEHAQACTRMQHSLRNMHLWRKHQKHSPQNSEDCIIINTNPPQKSAEDSAERERSMKEAIEFANKKYGPPSNEIVRRKKRDPERQALEKFFAPFISLDTETMKSIKEKLEHYSSKIKESKTPLQVLRFQNRKELFKLACISIAQLRARKVQPTDQIEHFLLDHNFDYDGYVCALVDNLEIYLFDHLFKHDVKSRDEPYQIRLKLLRSQLNDKTNFRLRRGVINKTLTLEYLMKATEEDLKSNERKEEQKQMMERLVRESESWEDAGYQKQIKHEETQLPVDVEQRQVAEAVCVSISDDETVEEKTYKESVRNAYDFYVKCRMEMRQRIESLGDPGKNLMKNWKEMLGRK